MTEIHESYLPGQAREAFGLDDRVSLNLSLEEQLHEIYSNALSNFNSLKFEIDGIEDAVGRRRMQMEKFPRLPKMPGLCYELNDRGDAYMYYKGKEYPFKEE